MAGVAGERACCGCLLPMLLVAGTAGLVGGCFWAALPALGVGVGPAAAGGLLGALRVLSMLQILG